MCSPDFRTKGVWERIIDSEIGVLGTEATPKVTLQELHFPSISVSGPKNSEILPEMGVLGTELPTKGLGNCGLCLKCMGP